MEVAEMNSNTTFDEHMDHALDDALMGTFPASDPIAIAVQRPRREPVPESKGGARSRVSHELTVDELKRSSDSIPGRA
jgi:hypothetical protein